MDARSPFATAATATAATRARTRPAPEPSPPRNNQSRSVRFRPNMNMDIDMNMNMNINIDADSDTDTSFSSIMEVIQVDDSDEESDIGNRNIRRFEPTERVRAETTDDGDLDEVRLNDRFMRANYLEWTAGNNRNANDTNDRPNHIGAPTEEEKEETEENSDNDEDTDDDEDNKPKYSRASKNTCFLLLESILRSYQYNQATKSQSQSSSSSPPDIKMDEEKAVITISEKEPESESKPSAEEQYLSDGYNIIQNNLGVLWTPVILNENFFPQSRPSYELCRLYPEAMKILLKHFSKVESYPSHWICALGLSGWADMVIFELTSIKVFYLQDGNGTWPLEYTLLDKNEELTGRILEFILREIGGMSDDSAEDEKKKEEEGEKKEAGNDGGDGNTNDSTMNQAISASLKSTMTSKATSNTKSKFFSREDLENLKQMIHAAYTKHPDVSPSIFNKENSNGILHLAIDSGKYKVVRLFLDVIPGLIQLKDQQGNLPIHRALLNEKMKLKQIRDLVQCYPQSVSIRQGSGQNWLPIHLAMSREKDSEDFPISRLLLDEAMKYHMTRNVRENYCCGIFEKVNVRTTVEEEITTRDRLRHFDERMERYRDDHLLFFAQHRRNRRARLQENDRDRRRRRGNRAHPFDVLDDSDDEWPIFIDGDIDYPNRNRNNARTYRDPIHGMRYTTSSFDSLIDFFVNHCQNGSWNKVGTVFSMFKEYPLIHGIIQHCPSLISKWTRIESIFGKIDCCQLDGMGRTPLVVAIECGAKLEVIEKTLVELEPKPDVESSDSDSISSSSSSQAKVELPAKMKDEQGRLPLHVACIYNMEWSKGLHTIIKANLDALRVADPVSGFYPLMLLAARSYDTIEKMSWPLAPTTAPDVTNNTNDVLDTVFQTLCYCPEVLSLV